jgi:hypothetical protein
LIVGFDVTPMRTDTQIMDAVKRVEARVMVDQPSALERTASGGVVCPFASMHIDMVLKAA